MTIIEGISHVDAARVKEILAKGEDIYVMDVRELEEYTEGHIPGIPLLPKGEVPGVIEQFDKDAEYIIVCRSGRRSLDVAKLFQQEGISKVHNYLGGMLEWPYEVATGPEHVIEQFSMTQLKQKK
ncbi:MAG: rhodanese-like domain-containing protein [Solibacillus sp.]